MESGRKGILVRYGGEEFLVLLPGAGRERALRMAEAIRRSIARASFAGEGALPGRRLTVSLGIAAGAAAARRKLVAAADPDPARLKPLNAAGVACCSDAAEVIARDDVDVVAEMIGGTKIAKTLVMDALSRGKSVVTANKHLMAESGAEIVEAARSSGAALGFSAAVCGGVPVLLALRTGLVANEIASVAGIVNGTCNYVLTRMTSEGRCACMRMLWMPWTDRHVGSSAPPKAKSFVLEDSTIPA